MNVPALPGIFVWSRRSSSLDPDAENKNESSRQRADIHLI
jgi:hypothetical protein